VSRQDPGAATGQQPYEPTRCTCGCLSTLHKLSDAGVRVGCSNSNCACKALVEVAAEHIAFVCPGCLKRPAVSTCCTSHNRVLCHGCYRRTHFVEVCVSGCPACAREGLDPAAAVSRG